MGGHTEAVVELLDLYPTLIDLADLEPPHELRGQSLRPVLEDPSASWQRPAYTQVVREPVGMGYSVRYGDWRLTQWGRSGSGGVELYDVTKDKKGYYNYANDSDYQPILDRLYSFLQEGYPQIERGSRRARFK